MSFLYHLVSAPEGKKMLNSNDKRVNWNKPAAVLCFTKKI